MKFLATASCLLLVLCVSALTLHAASWPLETPLFAWRAATPAMGSLTCKKKAVLVAGKLTVRGGTARAVIPGAIEETLSIEISFAPARLSNMNARIFDLDGQWAIWQQQDRIALRVPEQKALLPLLSLPDDSPVHLLITISQGMLTVYVNGEANAGPVPVPSVSIPANSRFTLGTQAWRGDIYSLALYARKLNIEESLQSAQAMTAFMRQVTQIRDRRVMLRVTVTNLTPTPTPEAIAPYRHALIAFEYRIDELVAGEFATLTPGNLIRVARWGILGGKQTTVKDAKIGESHYLLLEPFEDRPELSEQYTVDKLPENFTLPYLVEIN